MDLDPAVVLPYAGMLLEGLAVTLLTVLLADIFGTLLGFLGVLGKLFGQELLRWIAPAYVDGVGTLPELVVILRIYACFPLLFGPRLDAPIAGVLELSLFSGACPAEIFRAGIRAVPRAPWEVARALGLAPLPDRLRIMLPALIGFTASLIRASGLLAAINVGVLAWRVTIISGRTCRCFEMFTMVAVVSFILIFPLSLAAQAIERCLNQQQS